MGAFVQKIEIGEFEGRYCEAMDALVDTGATYTCVPRFVLERLGISPAEERPFILANGQRVSYGLAWVRVRLGDREQPTLVIFGDPESEPLIGAFTLEDFGLSVDATNHRLVPTPGFLVGIREGSE